MTPRHRPRGEGISSAASRPTSWPRVGRYRLVRRGHAAARVLAGGTRAWAAAGRPVETGPTRRLDEPDDVVRKAYEKGREAMVAYLRWEEALDADGRSPHPLFADGDARP